MKTRPMSFTQTHVRRQRFFGITVMLAGLLASAAASAQSPNGVSALGRLEPHGGIIRVGSPSIPEAISGSIVHELLVKKGDRVSKGQLLAITDSAAVVDAAVHRAEAEVLQATLSAEASKSHADEICVRADVSAAEANRRSSLLERNLASREETEAAQGDAKAGKASCIAAQANVRVAESSIEVAKANLVFRQAERNRTRILSPIDAVVLDITAMPGELILLDGLLELGQTDRMVAIAEVYETDINRVRKGQTATVRSDALSGPLRGTVEFIALKVAKQDEIGTDPAARKDARIIEVEIALENSSKVAALTNLQVEIVFDP